MNKQRRLQIRTASNYVKQANDILSCAKDEEETAFDNLSEGLQATQRGGEMESNIEILDEILNHLTEASDLFDEIE